MLNLEIITPEKKVLDETVDSVTIPTASGEVGILAKHAPLISSLRPGILSYSKGGTTAKLVISGGFVEVSADRVSILSDIAEDLAAIDTETAKSEREAAEKIVSGYKGTEEDFEAELEKLERANARLQLASGK